MEIIAGIAAVIGSGVRCCLRAQVALKETCGTSCGESPTPEANDVLLAGRNKAANSPASSSPNQLTPESSARSTPAPTLSGPRLP